MRVRISEMNTNKVQIHFFHRRQCKAHKFPYYDGSCWYNYPLEATGYSRSN